MSLLKQNTIKKEQIDKNAIKLNTGNYKNRKYKIKAICKSLIYAKKSKSGYLARFYYFIL